MIVGKQTEIKWCDASWNPWWGCVKVSPGCDNCYAETFSRRVGYSEAGSQFPIWGKGTQRRFFGDKHWNEPLKWDRDAAKRGVRLRVFCASMADVMEDDRSLDEWRNRLWRLIEATPNLNWLILTKRPQNFRRFLPKEWLDNPQNNVWLGTTVESNEYLWRLDALLDTPAEVRYVSYEPALEEVDFRPHLDWIDWVIVGGESQTGARPFNVKWAEKTVRDCAEAGVPCFVKQLGAKPVINPVGDPRFVKFELPVRLVWDIKTNLYRVHLKDKAHGADPNEWPAGLRVQQFPDDDLTGSAPDPSSGLLSGFQAPPVAG